MSHAKLDHGVICNLKYTRWKNPINKEFWGFTTMVTSYCNLRAVMVISKGNNHSSDCPCWWLISVQISSWKNLVSKTFIDSERTWFESWSHQWFVKYATWILYHPTTSYSIVQLKYATSIPIEKPAACLVQEVPISIGDKLLLYRYT